MHPSPLPPLYPMHLSPLPTLCSVHRSRLPTLCPMQLRERLAEFLALHISNFYFAWPWQKWSEVLDRPPQDPQRMFCISVLQRLMRLSFHEHLATQVRSVHTRECR